MQGMVALEAFDVDIVQPSGILTYELEAAFFGLFENSLLERGKLTAKVRVNKPPTNIQLLFSIKGGVELVCDRSLEPFDYPIQLEKKVDFKLGHEHKELDENLYMIEQHAPTINIAQHLYDFVSLAIPMKKIHPKLEVISDE